MKTEVLSLVQIVRLALGLCLLAGAGRAQQSPSDSLKQLLTQPLPDTSRALLLERLGSALMYSRPAEAMRYVQEGLTLSEQKKYPRGIARNRNRLGSIYRTVGSYTQALEAHLEALKVAQQHHDLEGMARAYNSIGILYSEQKDSRKAIEYFTRTKALAEQLNDAELVEISLTNIGTDYALLGQLDSALVYTLRAYEMAAKNPDESTSSVLFINLGNIHYRQKNYPLALEYYRRSLPLSEAAEDQRNLSQTYFEMARVFQQTRSLDSCRYYAEKALRLAQDVKNPKNILDAATLLAALYEPTDLARAYRYYQQAMAAKDQMFAQEKVRQLENLGFKEELNRQQLEYEQIQYRSLVQTYALLAGIVVALLIAFLLYRNMRTRQKANQLLQYQKDELQHTLTELKATQAQLIQSEKMASLGELTAGIAHEIQNPLNFVNNYSELNLELIDEMRQELERGDLEEIQLLATDLEENERKILRHGKQAEAIVRGMQQHSRRSSGTRELTDLNALAQEYVELAYNGMSAKDKLSKNVLTLDFDASLPKVALIPGDVGRVILNLMNNAFYAVMEKKETQPEAYEPAIKVTTRALDRAVEIRVKDNGTGIPEKYLDKLFQPFFTTKPTGQGTGLGLSLAYDIVIKGHSGQLNVESTEGAGTTFSVQIPQRG
ncbi:hypothetical protein GCM10027275_35400 [Rhabdobacter roseus]